MRGTRTKASNATTFATALTIILMLSGCASLTPAHRACPTAKPTLTSLKPTADGGITMNRSDSAALLNYINDLEACTYAG